MGLVVAGHAALAGGRVRDALLLLREAWAGLADSGHEFRFRCRTLLATALAQAGQAAQAAPLLAGIVAGQHPAYRLYAPDDLLARAWGAAAEGSTTEALSHAVAAADLARETGAPAYEVLAWQTAVQFGDATAALPRLTALAELGPRAMVARAHARAWADAGRRGAARGRRRLDPARRPRRRRRRGGPGGRRAPSAGAAGFGPRPPRPSPRSWPAGPAPAPRPWRSRSDRCR